MSDNQKLKPCPFCGGEAKVSYRKPYSIVYCKKCKASTNEFCDWYEEQESIKDAVEAWNRRTYEV